MNGHTTLMLAAVAVIAAFVPIVVVVRWLESHGRLGDPDRRLAFRSYGPLIAGVLSAGTVAVHLSVIGDHAVRSSPAADPILFLCSVGLATSHPTAVDTRLLGFVPLGIASLAVAPLQGAWSLPRLWRGHRTMLAGLAVAIGSLAVSLTQVVAESERSDPAATVSRVGEVGTFALVGEGVLLVAVAVMVVGRPRRIVDALHARAIDAYVATALAIAGVAIFTVVALVFGHVGH